jgi:PAS domain S-box-containing protein
MDLGPASALATAVEGLLVVDRAGRCMYANPAAERILGRPAAELAASSMHALKAYGVDGAPIPADDLPALRVMRTGERSASSKHCVERPDGSTALVCHTATLICDSSGVVEGAVASLLDITGQSACEEEPPRDMTFRAFVERSPDGVALHRDDKLVYANPALRRMLGYDTLDEIVGRSIVDFVHPDDRSVVSKRLSVLRGNDREVPVLAERLLHRDGHAIEVEVSSRPIAYDGEATILAIVVDVTERKRMVRELDHTVSMLRATLESTADGILVVGRDGRITTYNERFAEMWRIPASVLRRREDESAIAFVIDQLVDPDAFLVRMRELYADPNAESFDRFQLTDGRCYERHSLPQRIDGQTVGRVWSFRDVTARKKAEDESARLIRELAAKHELLQSVVDHAPVGICLLRGPELLYELVNPTFEKILGVRPRLGRRAAVVVAQAAAIVPVLEHVLETGEPHHSVDVAAPSIVIRGGETKEAYLWKTFLRVPGSAGDAVLALIVDLTEQVEARRRIEELATVAQRQAAELESVHSSMLDGVVVCDARGIITHVNDASGELTGIEKSALIGRTLDEYATLVERRGNDGEPIDASCLPIGRALAGQKVVNSASWSARTGRKVFIRCNAAPIRDAAAAIVGAVAVERDVSDVVELDAMRDQFIRVAAHELKTPVAIMKGYADMLLRSSDHLPVSLRGAPVAIERGAKRIDRLVNDLLGVSQLLMGCLELRREPLDLAELVGVTARQVAKTTGNHELRIESASAVVFGDRVRLTQVIDTLLDNAIRYAPSGGPIEVSVTTRGTEAVVCVRDHGVGIPREKQERIFERFYRAHTDTPHDYGGMGVGLYIAREVITQHGGRMWFQSEEDRGSEFCFGLPLQS